MPLLEGKMVEEASTRFQPQASQERTLPAPDRTKHLRLALRLVGVTFIVGIYALTKVWPSGWAWHMGHTSHYLQMILAVYATLGVFLLLASRNPLANLSLIWFTVWSSVAHGAVMAAQALTNPADIAHLWGDVPALFVIAVGLAFLTSRSVPRPAKLA